MIIDVRTLEEYGAGHAPMSRNIPFPHIHSRPSSPDIYIPQTPEQFVSDVLARIPDLNTPILTMCRTGDRSVLAANLLADDGYAGVRNLWQGSVGNVKTDPAGKIHDLDNNGVDGDLDGWSGYQELPVDKKLLPQLIYPPYEPLYYGESSRGLFARYIAIPETAVTLTAVFYRSKEPDAFSGYRDAGSPEKPAWRAPFWQRQKSYGKQGASMSLPFYSLQNRR